MTTLPSLYRLAGQHELSFPGREAFVYGDERFTFGDVFTRANRLASALAGLGVGEGDRLLWLGQNAHRVFELLLASSRLGAMLCCANWRQSEAELAFVIEDFDPKVVFWQQEEVGSVAERLIAGASADIVWVAHDAPGPGGYEQLLAEAEDKAGEEVPPAVDRPLLVLYTAAFGGRPNGAQLSDLGLFLQALTHVPALDIRPGNAALVSTPMFHIVAWLDLLPTFMMGGKTVIARRVDPQVLCALIDSEQITTGRIQPPTAMQMAEINADGRYDLSGFRSALKIPGWTEMTARGPEIGGTGQTEVAGPIVIGAWAGQGSTPFCGRIAPIAEAAILDEDGNEVPSGELGELTIRGPIAGLGYWNRPELNAQRLVGDWWKTGDLARRDADGTISFVSPKLQMLKSAGENIYAAEVEAILKSHPSVANAAIIGQPDPVWTQTVVAIVEAKPDQELEEGALIDFVREKIARYKAPRKVLFVPSLPMSGFVPDYRKLDAEFGGGNYPGQANIELEAKPA